MKSTIKNIPFSNKTKPKSNFDVVKIEELLGRQMNHDIHKKHLVNFYILLFASAGAGIHTVDFKDYAVQKGTILLIRKDQIQKFSKSNLEGIILLFKFDFLGSYFIETEVKKSLLLFNEFLHTPDLQLPDTEFGIISDLMERIKKEYYHVEDEFSPSIIRSELQILINRLYRLKINSQIERRERKYLSEFILFQDFVERKYTQSLKVKDYAKWLGVSTKKLNTITNDIVNKSAKEFIDEICINNIKRQLINSDKSVKEIAYHSGFEEPSNFYNFFKKRVGNTPDEYRQHRC